MRPRIYILLLITTMLVMRTRQIEAQIFEVSAGASTSYGAEGGSLTIHGEQTESVWNARSFLYQLGTIKLVLRGSFDGTRQEAYGRANCEPAAAG
jgi:hypothetical protein